MNVCVSCSSVSLEARLAHDAKGCGHGHGLHRGCLGLLLLVPVVDDHPEASGGVGISAQQKERSFQHAPLLVIEVGMLLLQPGGLRLHELIERGQLLAAAGGGSPCAVCQQPII